MKKYLSLIVLLVLAFVIVGCTETTSTTGETFDFDDRIQKQTVIKVWLDDTNGDLTDRIIPAFEKANPGYIVEFQHMSTVDAREKLKTYGQSGNGADVFQFPHDHMAQAILDDLVYVLPDELKTRLEARVMPVALNIATSCYDETTSSFECAAGSSEKLFAVPISIESVTLFYNKALITQDKLPTTFEQLLADSKVYREANEGKRYFGTSSHWADSYFNQFIFSSFGWTPFGPNLNDASEVGFQDENFQAAVNWMITNLKPEVTGNGNTDSINYSTLFQEGNLPFIIGGPWNIATYRDNDVDFGSVKIPTINGNPTNTFAGAQMVSVYKYSKNANAAMKFVEFLTSNEAAEILYEVTGKTPALKEEILDIIPGVKDDVLVQVMLDQLKTSVPMPTIPDVTYYWGPGESLMKKVWNSAGIIANEVVTAEKSYKASKDLAS